MKDPFPFSCPPSLSSAVQPLATTLGLSTLPTHIHEIISAYLLYECAFRLLSPALSRLLAPRLYSTLTRRAKLNWDAHVVSQMQSLLINSLALWLILTDPSRPSSTDSSDAAWQARLWSYTPATAMVQSLAAGYFLWDALASFLHTDVMGLSSLWHALAALGVTVMGFRPFANYYGLNFVLYELSTPFLNVHWFLDKLGYTGSWVQFVNGILLLAVFAGCRLGWGTWQSLLIYGDVWRAWWATEPYGLKCKAYRVVMRSASVPAECMVLPSWLALVYVGSNTVLSVLNFWWFYKMVLAVRKRFQSGDPADKGSKGINEIDAAMGSKEHDD
jgi:hypothetical protein